MTNTRNKHTRAALTIMKQTWAIRSYNSRKRLQWTNTLKIAIRFKVFHLNIFEAWTCFRHRHSLARQQSNSGRQQTHSESAPTSNPALPLTTFKTTTGLGLDDCQSQWSQCQRARHDKNPKTKKRTRLHDDTWNRRAHGPTQSWIEVYTLLLITLRS